MFDSVIVFSFYLGPLFIYAIWKITQWLRLGLESLISVFVFTGAIVLTMLETSSLLGQSIPPYAGVLGYWSFVWPIMFWIGLVILRYRRYYTISRSIIISFLATVSALAVWEIPIHAMTIYFHPTLYQVVLTSMLAYPTLAMIIPFRMETRYDVTLQKPFNRNWRRYLKDIVITPIIIGIVLIIVEATSPHNILFNSTGYPVGWFTMILRIGYALIFLEYLWHTPKSRIISTHVVVEA